MPTVHPKSAFSLREEVASTSNSVSTVNPSSQTTNELQEAGTTNAGKGVQLSPFSQPTAPTFSLLFPAVSAISIQPFLSIFPAISVLFSVVSVLSATLFLLSTFWKSQAKSVNSAGTTCGMTVKKS